MTSEDIKHQFIIIIIKMARDKSEVTAGELRTALYKPGYIDQAI